MRNINRVIMAGNMTRDPDLRQLPSDTQVANFGLALNRRYKDREGEVQEETTFVDCEAFGRQAEVLRDYGRKGRSLFVEGRLRLDQWQDREGHNRSKLRVVVDSVQFLDSPTDHPAEPRDASEAGPERLKSSRQELEEVLPF